MNSQLPERPTKIEIDVAQWRRDIQTFAETTLQALEAITSDLSSSCTQSTVKKPPFGNDANHSLLTPNASDPTIDSGADRMAKLKSQLAQRIYKPK